MEKSQNPKLGPATDFYTTDPTKCVKILTDDKNAEFLTYPEVLSTITDLYPNRSALMYQDESNGTWKSVSYREYKSRIEQVAKAFLNLGLERKGRVAILAFNSVEWNISALAAIQAGGQHIGIYNTNSAESCYYILKKSHANIVIVDDDVQLEKILKFRNKLPHLRTIIQTHPSEKSSEKVIKWDELEQMDTVDCEETYQRNLKEITSNSCCAVIFTSGTTGNPKGAMLSHDNLFSCVNIIAHSWKMKREIPERFVSFLPLSHVAGTAASICLPLLCGGTVYFPDKDALKGTLVNTLKVARPTFFFAVPRIYEKFCEKIQAEIDKTRGFKKFLITWAMEATKSYNIGNRTSRFPISYIISKKLVIDKMKSMLGLDKCRNFGCGSAPLSTDLTKFLLGLDILLVDGFGMTEIGIISIGKPKDFKIGTVGRAENGVEIKINNPDSNGVGEIYARGRTRFMGYLDELEKTRETLDDENWVHSGDLGKVDEDGYLYITGRIKELIITAGGENIPFLNIEKAVKDECSAISNSFLVGDKKKFLTILITLKTEIDSNGAQTDNLAPESLEMVKKLGLDYKTLTEVLKSGPRPKILQHIQEAIERANCKASSRAQKIQKFLILPNDFSHQTGELGPTLKLKRNFVIDKYKKEIDQLYTSHPRPFAKLLRPFNHNV